MGPTFCGCKDRKKNVIREIISKNLGFLSMFQHFESSSIRYLVVRKGVNDKKSNQLGMNILLKCEVVKFDYLCSIDSIKL